MNLTALQVGDLGIELLINANGCIYAVGADELRDYVFCYVFSNFQVVAFEQGFAECLCIALCDQGNFKCFGPDFLGLTSSKDSRNCELTVGIAALV